MFPEHMHLLISIFRNYLSQLVDILILIVLDEFLLFLEFLAFLGQVYYHIASQEDKDLRPENERLDLTRKD